jgi:hypothetical protein
MTWKGYRRRRLVINYRRRPFHNVPRKSGCRGISRKTDVS